MTAAPLPSPIPRARGSRSAADETFSRFLESSLHVPGLTLPPEPRHFSLHSLHHHDDSVEFNLLLSRDGDSVGELIRSAREVGSLRINCRGVFEEELYLHSSVMRFLQNLEGNGEEVLRIRFNGRSPEWGPRYLEDPDFECFSKEFEKVASKLDAIAKEVLKILSEELNRKLQIEEGEATLSIYSYTDSTEFEPDNFTRTKTPPQSSDRNSTSKDSSGFALRVRLDIDTEHSEFCHSTVVVALGKQMQEWSHGELKSDSTEHVPRPETHSHGSCTSFSFEYHCSLPTMDPTLGIYQRTISLFDQVLICIVITFLLNFFL